MLFKSGRYLSYARDPAGRCEVAYIHIVYGLPGVCSTSSCCTHTRVRLLHDRVFVRWSVQGAEMQDSTCQAAARISGVVAHALRPPPVCPVYALRCLCVFAHGAAVCHAVLNCALLCCAAGVSNLVSDRDFVLRAVRVFFPNGMCVLSCHSVGPGEVVPGDPGPVPRMIRCANLARHRSCCMSCCQTLHDVHDVEVCACMQATGCRRPGAGCGSVRQLPVCTFERECCLRCCASVQGPHVAVWLCCGAHQLRLLHQCHSAGGP